MDKSSKGEGHHCFLCLDELPSGPVAGASASSYRSRRPRRVLERGGAPVKTAYSIQCLSRYLKLTVNQNQDDDKIQKVEEEDQLLIPPRDFRPPLGLLGRGIKTGSGGTGMSDLDDQGLKVGLCEDCAPLNDHFGRIYGEMEQVEMRLLSCLDQIHQKMLGKGRAKVVAKPKLELEVLEGVRTEAMRKCSQILRTTSPRVMLEKLGAGAPKLERICQEDNPDNNNDKPFNLSEVMPSLHSEIEIGEVEVKMEVSNDLVNDPGDMDDDPDPDLNALDLEDPSLKSDKSLEDNGKDTAKKAEPAPESVIPGGGEDKPTPPLECQYCKKPFKRPDYLVTHLRTHTGEKPYQCEICKKSFAARGNWKKHQNVHNNTRRHKCLQCKKSFRERNRLALHQQKMGHRGQSTVIKAAKANVNLIQQLSPPALIKIPKDLIVSCVDDTDPSPEPGPSPIFKMGADEDHKIHDLEPGPGPIKVTNEIQPGLKFAYRPTVNTTPSSSSSSSQNQEGASPKTFTIDPKTGHYRCNLCPLVFEKYHPFWMHEKQAHPKEKFRCPECGEEFALREDYTRHRATHKFECAACHRTFPLKGYLTNHQHRSNCRLILGIGRAESVPDDPKVPPPRPEFKCTVCQKVFRKERSLKMHMPMHADETLHVCDLCGISFTKASNLKQHLAKHNNPNLHQCFECKTWFIQKDNLISHQQRTGHVKQK